MEKDKTIYFNRATDEVEKSFNEASSNSGKEVKTFEKSRLRKKRRKYSLRVRRFAIKHNLTKRLMEFGCHLNGIHWLNDAILYFENGCVNCRGELEI